MKIGKEIIPGLTQRNIAAGLAYYWEPSPAQRKAKWKTIALGMDTAIAVKAAKAQNEKIADWKAGGARPAAVAKFVKASTLDAVLTRYQKEVLAAKGANTQRVDRTAIARLREWAGDMPWQWISRARVKALRDAMMQGVQIDGPGHSAAFHLLTTLRKILGWWIRDQDLKIPNPAAEFDLPAPSPRDQIWERDCQAAFAEAAIALGWGSVELAFQVAVYTGQREADVLGVQRARWREISLEQLDMDEALHARLKSDRGPDAGKAMGIYVKQNKGQRWVGVPIEGRLRERIEAAIAASIERARAASRIEAQHVIVNDRTARAWGQSDFIHKFAEIRNAAVAVAIMESNIDLAERLDDLNFQDLRRTCIVTLGGLGLNDYTIGSISGHKQETIKKILEVYMPRTIAAAARGVVARIGPKPASDETKEERA